MGTFVHMTREGRAETLRRLHAFFLGQNVGFLLPVLAALPNNHEGCSGNRERFYSADDRYSCDDEGAIRDILTAAE